MHEQAMFPTKCKAVNVVRALEKNHHFLYSQQFNFETD